METHTEQVAALPPEAQIYYKDLVARAKDSIDARSQTKIIIESIRERDFPNHLMGAARLATSRLRAMHDPDHARSYDTAPLVLEQREYEDHRRRLAEPMYGYQDRGQEDEAESIRAGLAAMVSPTVRAAQDKAEFAERQQGYYKHAKAESDRMFERERQQGIEHVMANKLVDRSLAETVWDKDHASEARSHCDPRCNVMVPGHGTG